MRIWPPLLIVVGQCLSAAVPDLIPGKTTTVSTPTCEPNVTCSCPPGTTGSPHLFCYRPGSRVLSVSGEKNRLQDWNNIMADIHLPGRARLTELVTKRAESNEKCHFQIFGETRLHQGRLMLVGVELNFRILAGPGVVKGGVGTRLTGVALGKWTKFTEWGRKHFIYEPENGVDSLDEQEYFEKDGYNLDDDVILLSAGSGSGEGSGNEGLGSLNNGVAFSQGTFTKKFDDSRTDAEYESPVEWGDPVQLSVGGLTNVGWEVGRDHFARLTVSECSTEILFRPSALEFSKQTREPGLAVILFPEAGDVEFPYSEQYIAGKPRSGGEYRIHSNILLHTNLMHSAEQDRSATGVLIEAASAQYRQLCGDGGAQTSAMVQCGSILDPNMMNCLYEDSYGGSDGLTILTDFKMCIECACSQGGNSKMCFVPPLRCQSLTSHNESS